MSGQFHTPAAVPLGKEPPVPIGPQSTPGSCGEENNLFPMTGIEPQLICRPALSPSLCRLSHPGSLYLRSLVKVRQTDTFEISVRRYKQFKKIEVKFASTV
jgi:hypothetical protein